MHATPDTANVTSTTASAATAFGMPPPDTNPAPPLVMRLARDFGAAWVTETTVADWLAGGGDRVVLLAGDPVRFPEGQDVATVVAIGLEAYAGGDTGV